MIRRRTAFALLCAWALGSAWGPAAAQDAAADADAQPAGEAAGASAETQAVAPPAEAPVATIPVTSLRAEEPPAAAAADPAELEEIVVTAQRRAESLQQTPVSVTAFNSDKLQQRGIDSIADLSAQVPGMTIEPFPINMATLRIFIRGVGILDSQITQDTAVAIYQDGVYIGRSVGLAFDVADLERIEVLRGPQGTLYGRNTTGGAVSLITRRPSLDGFTMAHKLTLGNRSLASGKSMFNLPVTDDLAVKLAVLGSTRDGFVENTGEGGDFGDCEDRSLRFDARWLPMDWLTADYSYDYSGLSYYQYMYQAVLTPESNHGQAELFKRYAQSQTVYSHELLERLSSGAPMEASSVKIQGHAVTLAGAWGAYELKYIGARRSLADKAYADLSGGNGSPEYRLDSNVYDGPAADAANGGPTPLAFLRTVQSQTSHELQLSGELFDERLRFITGAFHFDEEAFDDRMHPVTHQFHSLIGPEQLNAIISANPQLSAQLIGLTSPRLVNLIRGQRNDINSRSTAYFGQATWTPFSLDQRLHLTLGYRHTEDKREAEKTYQSLIYVEGRRDQDGTAVLVPAQRGNDTFDHERGQRSFSNDSIAVIGAFDVTPRINAYAKYVEAYKSGGFDVRDPQRSGDSGPASDGINYGFGFAEGFDPEYVTSVEAGVKSEWFGRRLRMNLNLFNMDYTDRQISALIQGTISDTKTRNVGRSRIRGAELDGAWAVGGGVLLTGEYSFLDAKTLEVLDFEGNNVAENYQPYAAPRHSFVAALDWTVMERDWGALRSYVTYNYMGRRNGQTLPGRVGLTALESYSLLNARLGVDGLRFGGKGSFDVALWGKNLADKHYAMTSIDNLPQADRSVIWSEPRTYGVDFLYRWQ